VRSLNSRLVYKSKGVNCRGKRKEWELSVPLNVVSSVLWSNYYQRTNKIFNLFKSLPIPCKSCFLCCCLGCPLMDDRKEHFWMGKPGVNVAIILGRQVRQTPPYAKVPISSSFSGEQEIVATQAARGWAPPPRRHFKNQSCFCLGSAFEEAAFHSNETASLRTAPAFGCRATPRRGG
jgi:hypothetical protein